VMQYLDDSSGETLVKGEPEACPVCGRDMLWWPYSTPTGCTDKSSNMCWQQEA
jgi:hypothetical protein